jgi:hypothetical protein
MALQERGRAWSEWFMVLMSGAYYVESGRGAHARGSGTDRSAPPSRGREGAGMREHGRRKRRRQARSACQREVQARASA